MEDNEQIGNKLWSTFYTNVYNAVDTTSIITMPS